MIEWLTLLPLRQALRQLRNDALLAAYVRNRPHGLPSFVQGLQDLKGKHIAVVVAFEQPWALDWQLSLTRSNLPDREVLVFDNSRTSEARAEIAAVCNRHGIRYFSLPRYRTRHVNRSHGMAMSWIYQNVIRPIQPGSFGFLDHDLIPVRKVDVTSRIETQAVFGMINEGTQIHGFWNLWAGYCFFRTSHLEGKPVNFLYDFSRDLDTGGRNWPSLYRPLDRERLTFAPREFIDVAIPKGGMPRPVELIDGCWVHIGGIGYNDNSVQKRSFFEDLRRELELGRTFADLAVSPTCSTKPASTAPPPS